MKNKPERLVYFNGKFVKKVMQKCQSMTHL